NFTRTTGRVIVDGVICTTAPLAGSPNIQSYIQSQGVGVLFQDCDQATVSNLAVASHHSAFEVTTGGASSAQRINLIGADFDSCLVGFHFGSGDNLILRASGITAKGAGLALVSGSTYSFFMIQFSGNNQTIDLSDCYATNYESSAIWCSG